ncbi:MAG: isoaspartyl peptidase/L-asparaginase, partial [Bacteroidetes bacterium]|nr:isoaspartyl peptidase/L-asparaginase [Bacteroidota bacterium]
MKNTCLLIFTGLVLLSCFACTNQKPDKKMSKTSAPQDRPAYALAIHGGAGTIRKSDMTPELEAEYLKALDEALTIGEKILSGGGTSLEAVEQTIVYLEDSPLFNAGKGAVFTHEGRNELDASVMEGSNQMAGAVGGVTIVKNPIRAAIAVMKNSPHVLLAGEGAEEFAIEQGLDTVPNSYFFTQKRYDALQKILEKENRKTGMVTEPAGSKFGTVGCVALDKNGNLAAGTSTGGTVNKRWGRMGDSPIIGAGTYANNATCAVSCTGHGEFFIRYAVAHDVSARMEYLGEDLSTAA